MRKIHAFLKKPTSVDVIVNTTGSVLNVVFSAAMHFFLFRIMSPADYGVLTIWLSVIYVGANMLDFGTTATIYAYLPPLHEDRYETHIGKRNTTTAHKPNHDYYRFLKTLLSYQSGLALAAAAILGALLPIIDHVFLKTGVEVSTFVVTVIAIAFFILQNFTFNILYATRSFILSNSLITIANIIKLGALIVFLQMGIRDVNSILMTLTILGVVVFFVPLVVVKRDTILHSVSATFDRSALKLRYTFTYLVSTQIYNLAQRMDLFVLSYFGLRDETGYYAAAQKIILSIATAVVSITQVLSPMYSKVKTQKEARHMLRQTFMYLSIPSGIFLALIITPQLFFDLYLSKFAQAAPLARALAVPYIIFTLGNSALIFMLYTAKKPMIVLWSNVLYLILMVTGSYVALSVSTITALPIAVGVALTGAVVLLSIASINTYKNLQEK